MCGRMLLLALVVWGAVAAEVASQPPREPKDGKWVVPLTVQPVPVPVPALKYQLLPEARDAQPGNQIPAFYKCFLEHNALFHDKVHTDQQEKWSVAPLAELKDVKELIGYGGVATAQADLAARLDHVNWQILAQLKADGIATLLPDVQKMRQMALILKVKLRGEIARGEFDRALRTAQTMFTLARTFAHHPTLIGNLVGMAITTIALGAIEEWVEQPGAPNLYWALSDLPAPFIGIGVGMHGERTWLSKDFNVLREAKPLTTEEVMKLIALVKPIAQFSDDKAKRNPALWYGLRASTPGTVAAARAGLVKLGYKTADLGKLAPLQVVVMDDFVRYEVARDEAAKWANVPFWRLPAGVGDQSVPGIFPELLPASIKVIHASVRTQQLIALLRAVEAVRAYAAANGGTLPASPDAIQLPFPLDPVTGKPLSYELKDGTAVIRGIPPAGRKDEPAFNRVYEITIRK